MEKIAGVIVTQGKDLVHGVEPKVCAALKNLAGLIKAMDAMVHLEVLPGMNAHLRWVNNSQVVIFLYNRYFF